MQCHEVDYEILGGDIQVVELSKPIVTERSLVDKQLNPAGAVLENRKDELAHATHRHEPSGDGGLVFGLGAGLQGPVSLMQVSGMTGALEAVWVARIGERFFVLGETLGSQRMVGQSPLGARLLDLCFVCHVEFNS